MVAGNRLVVALQDCQPGGDDRQPDQGDTGQGQTAARSEEPLRHSTSKALTGGCTHAVPGQPGRSGGETGDRLIR